MTLRLAFMGTPDFAVPTLAEIVGAGHQLAAVYSQPPRPAGRGMDQRRSPVHEFAKGLDLEVRTPVSLKSEDEQQAFAALGLDAAVVVAYGLILPEPVLVAPHHGCFNLHASLLPRWRGAAPIQRAIMAGDGETGVAVMRMEKGLDTGPVCLVERLSIGGDTTAGELHDDLARLGAGLMVRALGALERGQLDCRPQSEDGVTYAAKIDKDETRIDFAAPATAVHDKVRGLSPLPGAWFALPGKDGPIRVKVLRSALGEGGGPPGTVLDKKLTVACGEGAVRFVELQRAGRAAVDAAAFLRGTAVEPGATLK